MIKVDLYYNDMEVLWKFSVLGHAQYAKHGEDIVCSATSMIVINTINSIKAFTSEQIVLEHDEDLGLIECEFTNMKNNKGSKDAVLLLNSMVLGLQSIENEYKKYIRINIHRGGE